mgnify:CR=1 FL=1
MENIIDNNGLEEMKAQMAILKNKIEGQRHKAEDAPAATGTATTGKPPTSLIFNDLQKAIF